MRDSQPGRGLQQKPAALGSTNSYLTVRNITTLFLYLFEQEKSCKRHHLIGEKRRVLSQMRFDQSFVAFA